MHKFKPLNDYIFGKTFGEKGDEEQLLSLLNAILAKTKHKKLVAIEIVEQRTFTAEVVGNKTSILDIRAVAEDGTKELYKNNLYNFFPTAPSNILYVPWYTSVFDEYSQKNPTQVVNVISLQFLR